MEQLNAALFLLINASEHPNMVLLAIAKLFSGYAIWLVPLFLVVGWLRGSGPSRKLIAGSYSIRFGRVADQSGHWVSVAAPATFHDRAGSHVHISRGRLVIPQRSPDLAMGCFVQFSDASAPPPGWCNIGFAGIAYGLGAYLPWGAFPPGHSRGSDGRRIECLAVFP